MREDRQAWTDFLAKHPNPRKPVMAKANKYHATKVDVDGIRFDSQREAARYGELKLLEAAGEITDLRVHPAFPLIVPVLADAGPPLVLHTIGQYHADFQYRNVGTGNVIVEDVKSKPTRTEAYRLRKKFVETQHAIVIVEVT